MWFAFALFSALFAGLHTFGQKVAVERKLDTYLINAMGALVAFICGFCFFSFTGTWRALPFSLYWLGAIGGTIFLVYSILRMEALRFIDSAIFFPLYKVIGPAFTAAIGIFFLAEKVSHSELIGIALSCAVPLLLITRDEHHRQKNLFFGLVLMVISTTLAAISAGINAYAVKPDPSFALPFLTITYVFTCTSGIGLFLRQHKIQDMYVAFTSHFSRSFIIACVLMGLAQFLSFYTMLLAFNGGDLSLVYSINAHYILIPVILSVLMYGEHWNIQKGVALFVSLFALVLLHR